MESEQNLLKKIGEMKKQIAKLEEENRGLNEKITKMVEEIGHNKTMIIDLSAASDDGLKLILLKVPIEDLIKKCTQVSRQWNRILGQNYFWRCKMEQDGYLWRDKTNEDVNKQKWEKLNHLTATSFKNMALKQCFERNFITDSWNLEQNDTKLTIDPRCKADPIWQKEDTVDKRYSARIEMPPKFLDGEPKLPPGLDDPIAACIAVTDYSTFKKGILIELAEEGLIDDIMDNYRPTIVVSEMIANRRDCANEYIMACFLLSFDEAFRIFDPFDRLDEDQRKNYDHIKDENGLQFGTLIRDKNDLWVAVDFAIRFEEGEAESWRRVEYKFKDYPAGMRFLGLYSCAKGIRGEEYGLKLANWSMKALCEKNVQICDTYKPNVIKETSSIETNKQPNASGKQSAKRRIKNSCTII